MNLGLQAGPHVVVKLGKLASTGAEYYWNGKDGHTVRIVLDINADL